MLTRVSLACLALTLTPFASGAAEIGSTEGFEPYLAKRNGKWGYLQHAWGTPEETWKTAIPFEYDWASTFNGRSSATVRRDGKYGLVDKNWKLVVPTEYDFVLPFEHGMAVVYRDGKYGAVDETGKLVIPLHYDSIAPFRDMGTATVTIGDKCGVINKHGELIVPVEYSLTVTNGMGICGAYVSKEGWKYVDWKGRPFAGKPFKSFNYNSDGVTVIIREDGRLELVDWVTGENIIPGDYASLDYKMEYRLCIVKADKGEGLFDVETRSWLIPAEYSDVQIESKDLFRVWKRVNGKKVISFLRRDGTKLADEDFDAAGSFSSGCMIAKQRGKWGVINRDGKWVIPCEFEKSDDIHPVLDHFAVWISGKAWGAFDKNGRQVLPFGHTAVDSEEPFVFSGAGKYAKVHHSDSQTFGIINTKFEWVVPTGKYQDFHVASECMDGHDYIPFKRAGKQGLYDLTAGKEVLYGDMDLQVSAEYDHILVLGKDSRWGIIDFITWKHRPAEKFVYEGFDHRTQCFEVANFPAGLVENQDRRFGVLNLSGKVVIPIEYQRLTADIDDGLYYAVKKGRAGFLNLKGKVEIPFNFEPAMDEGFYRECSFDEGHARVSDKGEQVLINRKGRIVARESQFGISNPSRLFAHQLGNQLVFASQSDSQKIHFLSNGLLYKNPGGCIEKSDDDLDLDEGRLAVLRDGKWGYLDEDGREVIACQFEEASQFRGGRATVKHEGKYYMINLGGTILKHVDNDLLRLRRKKS